MSLGVPACGDDEARAKLVIELAPAPAPGAEDCPVEPDTLEENAACLSIRVCRNEADACVPVQLVLPDEDHATPAEGELRFAIGAGRRITFDAQLQSGQHTLEAVLYADDGTEIARGRATKVRFGGSGARIRMYRHGRASCAGPEIRGETRQLPLARALHQAVALPNGDVLLLGGVTREQVTPNFEDAAFFQPEVEVYLANEDRFVRVSSDPFMRVFFSATLMPMPQGQSPGTARIRVTGGFTAAEDDDPAEAPAVRFDAQQAFSFHKGPLLPAANAQIGPDVDLIYDIGSRKLAINTIPAGAMLPGSGFNQVTSFSGVPGAEGPAAVLRGILSTGGDTAGGNVPKPMLVGEGYWLQPDGTPGGVATALLARRFGASASLIGNGPQTLIWGGNVEEADYAVTLANAGEILMGPAATTTTAVPATADGAAGLPPPTAFHGAASIGGPGVLIAGGLKVGAQNTSAARPIETQFSPFSLFVIRVDAPVRAIPITATHRPAIFQTMTRIDENTVLITGGMFEAQTMNATAEVGVVVWQGANTYMYQALGGTIGSLIRARWGHTATPLPNSRILVVGGLESIERPGGAGERVLRALRSAEILAYSAAGNPITMCLPEMPDSGSPTDAGSTDAVPATD